MLPNLPIISLLKEAGWKIYYLGSANGMCEVIRETGVDFFPIECGKFRRYWSIRNLTDLFRLAFGIAQAVVLLQQLRPHVVYSKGGYVALPAVIAAWIWRIPLIIHESDVTPGLVNRFAACFAKVVCVTFEETALFFTEGGKFGWLQRACRCAKRFCRAMPSEGGGCADSTERLLLC